MLAEVERDLISVSIHAPARGATPTRALLISLLQFQSTPPRGGRRFTPRT